MAASLKIETRKKPVFKEKTLVGSQEKKTYKCWQIGRKGCSKAWWTLEDWKSCRAMSLSCSVSSKEYAEPRMTEAALTTSKPWKRET